MLYQHDLPRLQGLFQNDKQLTVNSLIEAMESVSFAETKIFKVFELARYASLRILS
jgi:hypothetical protein